MVRAAPPYVDDATVSTVWASVNAYSDTMRPEEISRALGTHPTHTVFKGFKPGPRSPEIPSNGWFLSSQDRLSMRDARAHLDWVLDQLLPAADALASLRRESDLIVRCQLYWWAVSWTCPIIGLEQSTKLALLGFDLMIQFQIDSPETDESPHRKVVLNS